MAVSLSALRAGRPGIFLVLISLRGRVDPRAIVRLEGLGKLKKKFQMSSMGDLWWTGAGFLQVLRFSLPIIPSISPLS
jgi:hypothetical protein